MCVPFSSLVPFFSVVVHTFHRDIIGDQQTQLESIAKTCEGLKSENDLLTVEVENLKKHLVPKGSITIWSGSPNNIPKSWHLCNGQNGTPNLEGKFIVGDGGGFEKGNSGGTLKHNHSIEIEGHQLTKEEMPVHHHDPVNLSNRNKFAWTKSGQTINVNGGGNTKIFITHDWNSCTESAGGNKPHKHEGRSNDRSHLPPYYVLCYIMKIE